MFKVLKNIFIKAEPLADKISRDNIFAIAAQTAFFLILSAFPLAMFAVSVLQNFHIPVEYFEEVFSLVLSDPLSRQLSEFLSNAYNSSVSISFITLLVTLWSASQGIHAITNGLNRVHNTYENRNWLFLRLRAMLYTVIMFLIILFTVLIYILGSSLNNMLSQYISLLPDFVAVLYHLRYIIVFFYLVVLFALVYRNIPNLSREERKRYSFKKQLPGAVLASAAWLVLSLAISIYVDDFNGFSIYGGLTRLAVLMIWLYFCMAVLMIGAEFNYVYHDKLEKLKWFNTKHK